MRLVMKIKLIAFSVVLLLASCQDKQDFSVQETVDTELFASIEQIGGTKTTLNENNNVLWLEGDQVIAFMKTTSGSRYEIKPESAGSASGEFQKVDETTSGSGSGSYEKLYHNVVFYPYSESVFCAKNDKETPTGSYNVTFDVPEVQSYVDGSFADESFPMIAVSSDNSLQFRNMFGGLKLQFKGVDAIQYIQLEGIGREPISGSAEVVCYNDGSDPVVSMKEGAETTITLDCGSGVQLMEDVPATFIISVPPTEFASGMKLTVISTDGKEQVLTNTSANTIRRSELLKFPVITYAPELPGLQMKYIDENGIDQGPGIMIGDVVWAPVNCGYHKTDFKYGKLYQWGRKYGQGYHGELFLDGKHAGYVSDAVIPTIEVGKHSAVDGIDEDKQNFVLCNCDEYIDNWMTKCHNSLWNAGTEDEPVKTQFDPCPDGWRVPTIKEFESLFEAADFQYYSNEEGAVYKDIVLNNTISLPMGGYSAPNYSDLLYFAERGSNACYYTSSTNYSYAFVIDLYRKSEHSTENGKRHRAYSVRCVKDNNGLVHNITASVELDKTSIDMKKGDSETLVVTKLPAVTTDNIVLWSSENPSVATVDQNGVVTAVSEGSTVVTVSNGGKVAMCLVEVPYTGSKKDCYIDEYGVNHGKGLEVRGHIWAPVNCGYHSVDYKWGKLYQFGRRFGQGYDGDAVLPEIVYTYPQDENEANSISNANVFYAVPDDSWMIDINDEIWNSGTEEAPVKTVYDPCPVGWRVPTEKEIDDLTYAVEWETNSAGQPGYWSCEWVYPEFVPRVFLPTAGARDEEGYAYNRAKAGYYAASATSYNRIVEFFDDDDYNNTRVLCHQVAVSVRCVKE